MHFEHQIRRISEKFQSVRWRKPDNPQQFRQVVDNLEIILSVKFVLEVNWKNSTHDWSEGIKIRSKIFKPIGMWQATFVKWLNMCNNTQDNDM